MDPSAYLEYIVTNWQLIVTVLLLAIVAWCVLAIFHALLWRRYLLHRDVVWLEITPPASITKTPEATEQLFSVIHGARAARKLSDKLLGRSPVSIGSESIRTIETKTMISSFFPLYIAAPKPTAAGFTNTVPPD